MKIYSGTDVISKELDKVSRFVDQAWRLIYEYTT